MEPPPVLTVQLLPYQKEFLAWAIQQERGVAKGGILADEMGMGKTIQVSAQPLSQQPLLCKFREGRICVASWCICVRRTCLLVYQT